MAQKLVTQEDIDALYEYLDTKAEKYTGMSYADGIRAVTDWLAGFGNRPDEDE